MTRALENTDDLNDLVLSAEGVTRARSLGKGVQEFRMVNPLERSFSSYTPYHYVHNNPINLIDPTGMSAESTHTDKDGNVIAVYDDGDNGVYRHDNIESSTHIDGKTAAVETSRSLGDITGGGEQMGETEHWDEFVSPETGSAMTGTQIEFGASWDGTISELAGVADGMNLKEIASQSGPVGKFDIKSKSEHASKGRMLNGKYASARSAGNYLAGHNAQGGKMLGVGISFKTFQKLARALHVNGSVSNATKASIVTTGRPTYGPAPTYGENKYQYRMSRAGWNAAAENK